MGSNKDVAALGGEGKAMVVSILPLVGHVMPFIEHAEDEQWADAVNGMDDDGRSQRKKNKKKKTLVWSCPPPLPSQSSEPHPHVHHHCHKERIKLLMFAGLSK
ncbi:hypothetical protein KP509_09G092900 [Ceratopteris richardii]|uniref:Uncharacterized protein n=2 Tax=Ceratopteris richardii TaxID=49495 RepID=A0A8T2U961_CERRI|nr:hypothetical protein KP509_09G092900 [Ceratopteris richardii]